MRTRNIFVAILSLALVAFLNSLNAYAAKGDVGEKGKQTLIWHFDEGKGKDVKEAKGSGTDGKITGDINWVKGVSGSALEFSGSVAKAQYVDLPGADHLDITESLTMAAWISIDKLPAGGQENKYTIVYKNTYYMQLEPNGGSIAYYFYDTNNPGYHLSNNQVKADGKWTHLAITWDGKVARFYINGEKDPKEIDQKSPGRTTPGKNVFLGGENNACCPRFFQGRIDELTIANYALSVAEIKALMQSALQVELTGKLAAVWGRMKSTGN